MKKVSLYAFALVAFFGLMSNACEDLLDDVKVNIPYEIEAVHRLDPQTGLTFASTETISVDLDDILATKDATREDIESITTSSTSLAITDEDGVVIPSSNFSNVKSVSVEVENAGNGISAVLNYNSADMANFGTQNPIVTNATDGQFSVDLLAYFLDGEFTVDQKIDVYEPITEPIYVKSTITVTIRVKL